MPERLTVLALDCTGGVSEYMRRAHRTVTATANRRDHTIDSVFSSGPPRISELEQWSDVVNQIVQLACIPVRAGLCVDPRNFSGFFGPHDWGTTQTFARPDVLGDRSQLPDFIDLNLQPLHAPHDRLNELIDEVNAAIDAALPAALAAAAAHRRARRTTSRKGRAANASPDRAAKLAQRLAKPEFIGQSARRNQRALDRWRERYEELRLAFRKDPTTIFEAGTVRFREVGARVAPMPPYHPPPILTA